jgi:hypothetical protein
MTAATLHVDCSQPYLIVAQEQKNAKLKSGMRAPGLALFRDLERNMPERESVREDKQRRAHVTSSLPYFTTCFTVVDLLVSKIESPA